MTRIKIEVTANDIADGRRGSICQCPIALAARRTKGICEPWVGTKSLHWIFPERAEECADLPQEAIDFIWKFDRFKRVQPFTFYIETP